MSESRASLLLNAEEQAALDKIADALQAIKDLGLRHSEGGYVNGDELGSAVHVLQGFVVQHMLQRVEPGRWGEWFTIPEVEEERQRNRDAAERERRRCVYCGEPTGVFVMGVPWHMECYCLVHHAREGQRAALTEIDLDHFKLLDPRLYPTNADIVRAWEEEST